LGGGDGEDYWGLGASQDVVFESCWADEFLEPGGFMGGEGAEIG